MDYAPFIFNPLFFPITNLLLLPPLDGETMHGLLWKYFSCFLSIAFYIATSLWAGFVAHRHQFDRYKLDIARSVASAALGSFFFWPYCFPRVLANRRDIIRGKARLLSELAPPERKSKGAVLEIVIWATLWGVVMGMAIPGMIPSRLRSNEEQAVITLRAYARTQEQYRVAGDSGYCQNSRDLFFGRDGADRRHTRISQHRIDAFTGVPEAGANSAPSYGYVFYDDPLVAATKSWRDQFGYFAFPALPWTTGRHAYWIGRDGVVVRQEVKQDAKAEDVVNAANSPLHPQGAAKWEPLPRERRL